MLADKLYSFNEATQVMNDMNMAEYKRKDAYASKLRQFCQGGSSVEILTARNHYFVFYLTDKDYRAVCEAAKDEKKFYDLQVNNKQELNNYIIKIKDENIDTVVCIFKGNKILNPSTATSLQNHEVIVFTNSNFLLVLNALKNNSDNIKKIVHRPEEEKTLKTSFVVPDGLMLGAKVSILKQGNGIIQNIIDDKVTVLFDNGGIKTYNIEVSISKGFLKLI